MANSVTISIKTTHTKSDCSDPSCILTLTSNARLLLNLPWRDLVCRALIYDCAWRLLWGCRRWVGLYRCRLINHGEDASWERCSRSCPTQCDECYCRHRLGWWRSGVFESLDEVGNWALIVGFNRKGVDIREWTWWRWAIRIQISCIFACRHWGNFAHGRVSDFWDSNHFMFCAEFI